MNPEEAADAPIVALLDRIGEIARGQFAARSMVGDALAADPLAGTRFVAAVTAFQVFFPVGALLFVGSSHRFDSRPFQRALDPGGLAVLSLE
jgi:hypothetical protein